MGIESRDIAILSARVGVARFGASRFGFCPDDVEGAANDEPGEYIWKEHKPDRTDWTLQTPCLICGDASVASFIATPTSGAAPLSVQFTDTSTGGVTFWYWTFGDGEHSYEQNPIHVYKTAATVYTVTLWVSGPGGSDGPATDTITTASPPVASFTWNWPAEGDCSFTDTSTGDITSWAWDFSDGAGTPISSAVQNPDPVAYAAGGPYDVILTIIGPAGTDNVTIPVTEGSSG